MSLLRRALTGATITGLLAVGLVAGTTPAYAVWGSSTCGHDPSIRLFTANDGEYKLWTQAYVIGGYKSQHICFAAGHTAAGDLTITSPVDSDPLTVTPALADPTCPQLLHVQDPADFMTRLEVALTDPYHLCFGAGDKSFRITIDPPGVWLDKLDIRLGLDRDTDLADLYCASVDPSSYGCRTGTDVGIGIV